MSHTLLILDCFVVSSSCAVRYSFVTTIRDTFAACKNALNVCFFCRFKYLSFLDALVATIRVGRTQRVSVVRLNSFLV